MVYYLYVGHGSIASIAIWNYRMAICVQLFKAMAPKALIPSAGRSPGGQAMQSFTSQGINSLASCHIPKHSGYDRICILRLSNDCEIWSMFFFNPLSSHLSAYTAFLRAFSWNPNHLAVVWHHSLWFARAEEATIRQEGAGTWRPVEILVVSETNLKSVLCPLIPTLKTRWNKGIVSRFHDALLDILYRIVV